MAGIWGLDLRLSLAVLPGNCAALEAIQPSPTFLSAASMLGSKVTEVPFGSISLWFVLLLVPANAMLSWDPRRVLYWVFPLLVIDHVVTMFCFVCILSY